MIIKIRSVLFIPIALLFICSTVNAQTKKSSQRGEFYLSWGYNTEWYTKSNVKIEQPSLGNKYTFKNIKGHDRPGWDHKLLSKPITIPQYNYRIGYFFKNKNGLGVEINFDHTKFIFGDQDARISGTINNRQVDSTVAFNAANGYHYYLNNGANFLLFNIVKRYGWYTNTKENVKVDVLAKAGVGPVIPHVDNSFSNLGNSQPNKPQFQIGGWNVGTELALRSTFYQHVYLEFAGKLDYARYSNLKIYEGKASHAFGTAELILSLGYTFKTGKK